MAACLMVLVGNTIFVTKLIFASLKIPNNLTQRTILIEAMHISN